MSKIKLTGDTSGYVEISAPNVAANNTLELGSGTKILTNLDNVFTGVTTYSGNIDLNANLDLDDNNKILLGTGDDLQIYHSGNHSYIQDSGTGNLVIQSNRIDFQTADGSAEMARFQDNGAVSLSFNDSTKFETTNTGATVTGTLVSGSVTSELDLTAISSSISDTAVDVFVYDTRKDSDGGAWRKRTQHTSWYNETLNTSTRGSRKEFPAVAVIVAEVEKLTIYDGDDPDLPMWMVFLSPSTTPYSLIPNVSGDITSITALNGKISLGYHHNYGIGVWDFISEFCINTWRENSRMQYPGTIAERNDQKGSLQLGAPYIVDYRGNDVAMTVLPNAPIDDSTGLPVPTIAVGTDNGVSVIKDDGTVMSTASSSGGYHIKKVDFTDDHGLNAHIDSNTGGNKGLVYVDNINKLNGLSYGTYANWDGVLYANRYATNVLTYKTLGSGSAYPVSDFISMSGTDAAVGSNFTDGGLTLLAKNNESTGQGMVAFVTSDYNTGYMQGDIKGAFLSDTTVESFSATNLVTENFSANWTGATNGVLSVSNGQLTITNSGGGNGRAQSNTFATTSGKKYAFIVKAVSNSSASYRLEVRGPELVAQGTTNGQSLVVYFNGTGNSSTFVELYAIGSSGASATYEDAYVVELEEDRSVNNKGLQVFGTITKSAVATGADLVAYSGFSASNYLQQPYNSDLDFGTGDFSIMFWFKTPSGSVPTECFLHRGDGGTGTWGSGKLIQIEFNSTNLAAFLAESAFSSFDTVAITGTQAATGQWMHYTLIRRGTFVGAYLNGELKASTSSSRNLSNTSAKTWIGERPNSSRPATTTSLALFRMSASAPTDEQIKKIYNDEKHLYQENAKATLYGSSDAVTALAYDDSTELYHVGTSAGRSDFQGLRRINNTTTAVTTAISASDDLIAEQ